MKAKDFREMTPDDLKKEIDGITKALFDLRFKKVTDVVENPAEFKRLRRDLARVKTILREKELARPARDEKPADATQA